MTIIIAILAVLIGAAFCFGGWRFFLVLLPFWGLLTGFNIGTEATRALIGDGTFATLTSWAVGIVLALVFAALAYLYWYGAIALLAGTVGYIVGASAWGLIGSEQGVLAFIIGLAVGAVFAIVTLMLNVPKYLVVALTAIGGSAMIVASWFILSGQIPSDQVTWNAIGAQIADSFIWLVVWLALAAAGFLAQMKAPAIGPSTYELERGSYRYGAI
jgi:hypothetical protein